MKVVNNLWKKIYWCQGDFIYVIKVRNLITNTGKTNPLGKLNAIWWGQRNIKKKERNINKII